MTVYVDDMDEPATVGRLTRRWCHLVADSSAELAEFGAALGLASRWLQDAGTPSEHFDVTVGMRQRALAFGAVPVTTRELATVLRRRVRARSAS